MPKILIIGQALPAVKQSLPYDTTMLYDWLKEIGITKEKAQQLFEFEAVFGWDFPGHNKQGGHKPPTKKQMQSYWDEVLQTKVELADKVWILGSVASNFIESQPKTWSCNLKVIETIHPSRRNISAYRANKAEILNKIKSLVYDT